MALLHPLRYVIPGIVPEFDSRESKRMTIPKNVLSINRENLSSPGEAPWVAVLRLEGFICLQAALS
jgi:hypothetical protein